MKPIFLMTLVFLIFSCSTRANVTSEFEQCNFNIEKTVEGINGQHVELTVLIPNKREGLCALVEHLSVSNYATSEWVAFDIPFKESQIAIRLTAIAAKTTVLTFTLNRARMSGDTFNQSNSISIDVAEIALNNSQ